MSSEELEVLSNMIKLDNAIMNDNITLEEVLEEVNFSDIKLENALIIYNGSINDTKKIINSDITNSLLFPNNSYIGINKFLLRNRKDLELSTLKDDIVYQSKQDEFDHIIVVNDKLLFEDIKDNYQSIEYIEL